MALTRKKKRSVGRPPSKVRRDYELLTYVTKEEFDKVKIKAEDMGLSISQYLRVYLKEKRLIS
jgi:hypothetical protein